MTLLFALLGACVVGQAPEKPDGDRTTCEDRAASALPAYSHSTMPTGTRAQMACMDAGCHSAVGGSARAFAFAGTVYKETSAQAAVGGVTIRIFKKGGTKSLAEAITNDAGNFVIDNPAMFTEYPYETHVTACGTSVEIRPMAGPIPLESANCNAGGGCHGAGGMQGAIYMPD